MGGTVFATPPVELLELLELDELEEELLEDELPLEELLEEDPPPFSGGLAPPHAVSNNEPKNTPSIEWANPERLPIDILSPQNLGFSLFLWRKTPIQTPAKNFSGNSPLVSLEAFTVNRFKPSELQN